MIWFVSEILGPRRGPDPGRLRLQNEVKITRIDFAMDFNLINGFCLQDFSSVNPLMGSKFPEEGTRRHQRVED